jgi:alpha/beta superfamily hydrolase
VSESLRITTEDGVSLEAEADTPSEPRAALVFCHPHPQMGGTMNAPLLLALCEHLVDTGWAVLRFNFRGIGGSEGAAGVGHEEIKDARAALVEARSQWPGLPLGIAGWSFGGAVAVNAAAEDDSLVACVAVAPSVTEKESITAGLPPPHTLDLGVHTLFVVGANDEHTPPAAARLWAEEAGIEFKEVPGANHFFWGKYEPLAAEVGEFLNARL